MRACGCPYIVYVCIYIYIYIFMYMRAYNALSRVTRKINDAHREHRSKANP